MEGDDFNAAGPLQVLFTNISDVSCFNITIIDDDAFESNHSFTLHLINLEIDGGTSDSNLGVGFVYTEIIITDNDGKIHDCFHSRIDIM